MTEHIENLVTALREELQHYGEMLALLDQQQESAINRVTDDMLAATTAIQNHSQVIQTARREREQRQRELSRKFGTIDTATFAELTPLLPEVYRPLIDSLVEENNSLLQRVQQRARQNHLVLSRSVELMQNFLSAWMPARETQVYNGHGARERHLIPTTPLYEAIG